MGVMTDALLKNIPNIGNSNNATISNIAKGGQLGIGPHLVNLDAATPLVFPPLVAIVTHIPTMMKRVPHLPEIIKSLVERHAKTITGVDFGYELEEGSGSVLPDGQEIKAPTITKRTPISPNMTFSEIHGNLVWNAFYTWISMINHPDTHASKLASFVSEAEIDPFVFSFFSMDILLIQFDQTMLPKHIIDAAFVTSMWPKVTGNIGFQREIGTAQVQERSIDFNGILQHNKNTYAAGVSVAEMLKLHKANFDFALPIATTIETEVGHMGISREIEEIVAEFKQV